jgi:cellulose synthase/poly-beta-1,6-N-acetylglucosamine synthase-like glycosyltransferase
MATLRSPRQTELPAPPRLRELNGARLFQDGILASDALLRALAARARAPGPLAEILRKDGALPEVALLEATARHLGVRTLREDAPPPDPRLIDLFGASHCLRLGLMPLKQSGAVTVVATSRPAEFSQHREGLEAVLGPVAMVAAEATRIEAAILACRGPALADRAESRVALAESCRGWRSASVAQVAALALCVLAAFLWAAPLGLGAAVLFLSTFSLIAIVALRLAAALAALRHAPPEPAPATNTDLPVVSLIVAMYQEEDIAPRLVRRLSQLDYPRALLDVLIAVEAEDHITRSALIGANLPGWMRIVTVPKGHVKTKPRALNHALDQCRGSIVGVYDAEDAPESQQIRHVVERFARSGPEVACLQGILDFYNPGTNWISRCFALEYATWFRLVLPGLARLGLVVPLGGTTLFFRRDRLEELGGWDAHNVTEDADLGLRLARRGYRTELIATTTFEEANCRAVPWMKQRSRWIKGYMMTWAVHMRNPVALWRDLGPWRFLGVQVLYLGAMVQFLTAPLLWTMWFSAVGLGNPLVAALPPAVGMALFAIFLIAEGIGLTLAVVALRRTSHQFSARWVLVLPFYFPLAALASYKAALEVVTRPFYWDKTRHGIYNPPDSGV